MVSAMNSAAIKGEMKISSGEQKFNTMVFEFDDGIFDVFKIDSDLGEGHHGLMQYWPASSCRT